MKWGEIGWSSKEVEELTLEPETEKDPKAWSEFTGSGNGTPCFSVAAPPSNSLLVLGEFRLKTSSKLLGFFLLLQLLFFLISPLFLIALIGDFMKLNWRTPPPRVCSSSSSSSSLLMLLRSCLFFDDFLLHHTGILKLILERRGKTSTNS